MNQMPFSLSEQQPSNVSYALNDNEKRKWQAKVNSEDFKSYIQNESVVIEKETLTFFKRFEYEEKNRYTVTRPNYVGSESEYNRHEPDFKFTYNQDHPFIHYSENNFYIEQKWNPRVFFIDYEYERLELMVDKANFDHYKKRADKEQCQVFIHLVTPVYNDDLIFNVHDVQCTLITDRYGEEKYKIPVSPFINGKAKHSWMGLSRDNVLTMSHFVKMYMGIDENKYWNFYHKLHSNINYIANWNKLKHNPELIEKILHHHPTIEFTDKPRKEQPR